MKCTIVIRFILKIVGIVLLITLWGCGETADSKIVNVVEATYGGVCKDAKVEAPFKNQVSVGNATADVFAACNGKEGECVYTVNAGKLGDPAVGCTKDIAVKFKCGNGGEIRTAVLPNPHEKGITLSCAKK